MHIIKAVVLAIMLYGLHIFVHPGTSAEREVRRIVEGAMRRTLPYNGTPQITDRQMSWDLNVPDVGMLLDLQALCELGRIINGPRTTLIYGKR